MPDDRLQLGVGEVVDRRGQHQQRAAGELADGGHDLGIHLLALDLSGVEQVRVGHVIAVDDTPLGLHAVDHALDQRRLRGELAEGVHHRRHGDRADHLRDAPGETHEEAQLHRKADHGLVVGVDVRRRLVQLVAAHRRVAVDEDALPRNLDVIEEDQGVVLIEPRR